MANIISFPADQRALAAQRPAPREPGMVIILPVIRVERSPDEPSDGLESGGAPGRKRRRRASRS